MTAVNYPTLGHAVPTTAKATVSGSQSQGWLGTGCRLGLLGVFVLLHLPMVIFFGVIFAANALRKKN